MGLKLRPRSASVAEAIRIHPLGGKGWICIVWRRLDVSPWITEVEEGCHCKSDAGCIMSLPLHPWCILGFDLVVWFDQDTK